MTGFGPKRVYAYVVADLIHIGHLLHLQKCNQYGHLTVGVLTDKATMEKKPKPIIPFVERMAIVAALKCVDKVIPQETYSPLENVKKLKPDFLIESESHPEQPANEFVKSYGGKIIQSTYYNAQSSTKIKKRILENGSR